MRNAYFTDKVRWKCPARLSIWSRNRAWWTSGCCELVVNRLKIALIFVFTKSFEPQAENGPCLFVALQLLLRRACAKTRRNYSESTFPNSTFFSPSPLFSWLYLFRSKASRTLETEHAMISKESSRSETWTRYVGNMQRLQSLSSVVEIRSN